MTEPDAPPTGRTISSLRSPWLPLGFAFVWVAALAMLANVSANPVTLNRTQILESTMIVSATVDDPATGACSVVEIWRGSGEAEGAITVDDLPTEGVRQGESYILPLVTRRGGQFRVTPASQISGRPRLIYPATPSALAQLEAICGR